MWGEMNVGRMNVVGNESEFKCMWGEMTVE